MQAGTEGKIMDNVLLFILGQVITGAAIWGGIRVDIRSMHSRLERVEKSSDEAHQRIDRHLEQQAKK